MTRSRSTLRGGIRVLAGMTLFAMVSMAVPTWAGGMPIAPGDVLRISVTGAPDIGRDAVKVGVDGRIVLPGLDAIEVAGGDVDAARERVGAALVTHQILKDPAVLVEVVSYRPFYIGGAVKTPGALAYEAGLTVRHALILAGGIDAGKGAERPTAADLVELKGKYGASNLQLVELKSRIARLRAELDGLAAPDFSAVGPQGRAPLDDAGLVALNTSLFNDETAAWSADQEHLRDVVALIDFEIDVLGQQATLQDKERSLQDEQVRNARTLVEKGVMPQSRLQELERESSRLSRDLLENQAYEARARQGRQSNLYQIDAAASQRRVQIQTALRDAVLTLAQAQAENDALSAGLVSAGIALIGETGEDDIQPSVAIHRTADGASETIDAALDTPVLPGDVIEVSLMDRGRG